MKDTIQKVRRWLIRKLGGYPCYPDYNGLNVRAEKLRTETMNARFLWDMEMGEPDINDVRNYLAQMLAENIVVGAKVKQEQYPEYGKILFSTKMWVTFNPPEGQENL